MYSQPPLFEAHHTHFCSMAQICEAIMIRDDVKLRTPQRHVHPISSKQESYTDLFTFMTSAARRVFVSSA